LFTEVVPTVSSLQVLQNTVQFTRPARGDHENISLNQNRRKWPELLGVYTNKVREVVVAQGRLCAQTHRSVLKQTDLLLLFHTSCVLGSCEERALEQACRPMRSLGSGVATRLFTITFWKGYGRDPIALVGLARSLSP